ncbi:MAG: SMC-Scp complex subunit ScpB [Candidatus Thermoplasmatota archaeon]
MKGPMRAANPGDDPIVVSRNHGKPTQATELAKSLAASRKKGEAPKTKTSQGAAVSPLSSGKPTTASSSAPPPALAPSPSPKAAPRNKTAQLRFLGMKPMHVVEAALFAAGKPILVEEIVELTGLRESDVKAGIQELTKAYAERDTILEVGKAGTKWGMQVKSQASEPAAKFAPMEIPAKTLKTLALIAFHQPLKQSVLVEMVGSKAYDHVHELHERGLVKTREEGQTKILYVTSLFPEYFGLDASNPEEIRATMAKLVGLDPALLAKPAEPKVRYEETQEPAPTEEPAAAPAPTAT